MVKDIEEFCLWAKSRLVGCLFARAMFKAPKEYGIAFDHYSGSDPSELAPAVAAGVVRCIEQPETEGVVCLFPDIGEPSQIRALFEDLVANHGWSLRMAREQFQGQEFDILGVDVPVGEDQGAEVLAEVVAFAPFEYLPITRRAPVTAFSLRTKPALSDEPLTGRTERRANLAAIKFDVPPQAFSRLWEKSHELRVELVGEGNPLARARVAIGIPVG